VAGTESRPILIELPLTTKQYTIHLLPFILAIGYLQNCSENSSLQLRLHATPLAAIHRRLRFTLPWHMAPTKEIHFDWL